MTININVSAKSADIYDDKENFDLTDVNAEWNKEIETKISNPYNYYTSFVKISEYKSSDQIN
jgi:hypothetical protein